MMKMDVRGTEVVFTQVFEATRETVWAAMTDANQIPRWWGPRRFTTTVDKMDVRPGGAWRFVQRDAEGNVYTFHGEYREVVAPGRLVYTFVFEGMPDQVMVETVTLDERDGKTTVTTVDLFATAEARDGALAQGMEAGANESMERFAESLAKKEPERPKRRAAPVRPPRARAAAPTRGRPKTSRRRPAKRGAATRGRAPKPAAAGKGRYVDGFVLAVPKRKLDAYRRLSRKMGKIYREYGALEFKECVGDDLKVKWGLPFPRLLKLKRGETALFSWVAFKSRRHRDRVNAKVMKDPRMAKMDAMAMPFDMKRMASGGFEVLVDV